MVRSKKYKAVIKILKFSRAKTASEIHHDLYFKFRIDTNVADTRVMLRRMERDGVIRTQIRDKMTYYLRV